MARRQGGGRRQRQTQQPYDNALKALMEDHAAEIIPEFVPDTVVVIEQSNEIRRENIRADLVYLVQHKGELHVLHMELQTDRDSDMAARMLRYHVDLHLTYRLPVISVVLYLFETSVVESPYQEMSGGEELLTCHYRVIRLWTLDAEEYVRRHAIRVYTFLPGMKGANAALLIQAINEMKEHYTTQSQLIRHLTRFKTILQRSSIVTEEDKQLVEDQMQVYDSLLDGQPWFEERLEKKAAERATEMAREGELQALRLVVLDAIEARYPSLFEFAQEQISSVKQPDVFRLLVRQIYTAPDENAARFLLEAVPDW